MKPSIFGFASLGIVAALATTPSHAGRVNDKLEDILRKRNIEPAAQLENHVGLKIKSCRFEGAKRTTESQKLIDCLTHAIRDLTLRSSVSPISIHMLSLASGREFAGTFEWKPKALKEDSKSNFFGRIRERSQELLDLAKNYLDHDYLINITPSLRVTDLKLPVNARFLKPLEELEVGHLTMRSFAGEKGTLSGHVEFHKEIGSPKQLIVDFETNWKLLSKAPLKGRVSGELIPLPLATPQDESELETARVEDEAEGSESGDDPS